jgi:hypothetical protein
MLILDIECYSNYFLISFLSVETGKIRSFELHDTQPFDIKTVSALMNKYTTISFNGLSFDLPMLTAALSGWNNLKLKALCDSIIKSKLPSYRICNDAGIHTPKSWNHIDLIEVAPGMSSLKIYGGRLNAEKIQDLPITPDARISPSEYELMREYCANDLYTTKLLYDTLKPQIALRISMSEQYGLDLRSKSDAQIAETVICSELSKETGKKYKKPDIKDSEIFRYLDPQIITFQRSDLNEIFQKLISERFTLGANGAVQMPEWLKNQKIMIAATEYQMGIGGLHSCEKSQYVRIDENTLLFDMDVAGYYPSIILQQRLAPKSMGEPFLRVYQSIVTRRLKAKHDGDKVTADTLKICVNGSFGKLGSKYSALYAPDLLIQTTITGQLALLMLIERIESVGAHIISANTDGIVVYCAKSVEQAVMSVAWGWELETSYELERTNYFAIASRDVNNYVAVKLDGKTKGKGIFAPTGLAKNPDCPIIFSAVATCIAKGTPIEKTIRECKDIRQFVTVRKVTGGATWRGEYLGKAIRFYYSTDVRHDECIHYKTNSNRVPNSAGAKPLMLLGDFPTDIDYAEYITAAENLLCEVGA